LVRQIWPHRRYAHCGVDIQLLARFLSLAEVLDIGGDSVKMLLHAVKMLRRLGISAEDLCCVLAHASAYFPSIVAECGSKMRQSEVGYILVLQIYIAHTWALDNTCGLPVWHKYLFQHYCSHLTLRAAVFRLLKMCDFKLRVEESDLLLRHEALQRTLNEA
jgi:hypothetical protein